MENSSGCEMCKIPWRIPFSSMCRQNGNSRILIFSNAALTLINALDSSVDENRPEGKFIRNLVFSGY